MAREDLRAGTRAAFVAAGLGLIGLAVLLALWTDHTTTSMAALLAGVLLVVVAVVGRLPEEIGLQRISFGASRQTAREYREALYDAVQTALPELEPPSRGSDWHPDRPTYWVDELQLRIVVTWAPDDSYRINVSRIDPAALANPDIGVLLVTNVEEIDDLRAALRSQAGERSAVVRWRSPDDNDALRRTARELQAHNGS
jgi:uncharacterized membrane protein YqjE